MNFSNTFEVSLPPSEAWPYLMDVERVIPCMPGAELTGRRADKTFTGKISVKLGPVLLSFVCDAAFEEVDPVAHAARINAQGADSKGRGGVKSSIRLHLQPSERGSRVMIDTDLNMSGAVAQYGRGAAMIQTVANQVISQFAANLEASIAADRQMRATSAGSTPAAQDATQTNGEETHLAPKTGARPIGGFALLWAALLRSLRNWFGGRQGS
jgi:hypothetical protein